MRDKVLRLKVNKPRSDSFYDEFVAIWVDNLNPSTSETTHPSKQVDYDLNELMTATRGKALQIYRDMKRYRNKKRKERGEEVEEEEIIDTVGDPNEGASESDDDMEMDEDDEDSDEIEHEDEEEDVEDEDD
jgi:hypothetical protein